MTRPPGSAPEFFADRMTRATAAAAEAGLAGLVITPVRT